ncbi:VWA domain-containing protein [Streptomyces sp. NPDC057682]|uniref:VWA domain-containing protein n=1 Tax=Streptomyces sp. NPDC057682 TaxID=3346210 RepID=UPI00369659C4
MTQTGQPAEDIKVTADRQDIHLGEEFAVLVAPRELTRSDRSKEGVVYAVLVDDSWSMELRADNSKEYPVEGSGQASRKDVATAGVRALVGSLPRATHVELLTFAQESGVRFSGTAGELLRKGRWNGNVETERQWTNIEGALRRAYRALEGHRAASRRVVLVSDGVANFGEQDPGRLAALAAEAAGRELHTDAVGIGEGADFGLLERLTPTGMARHVASRARAGEVMSEVAREFAANSRDVVTGSGELSLEINPSFPVLAVYQLDPVRRRIEGAVQDGGGQAPSRIVLTLGAIREGEAGQPLYLIKLRAPHRRSARPMPVLRARGRLGSGSGARQLSGAQVAVNVVDNPMTPILRRDLLRQAEGIDLDREITDRAARAASEYEREAVYREGAARARRIPDPALAAVFDQAGGGLRDGMDPNDVANEARAASSQSSTRSKRAWFEEIPVEMPDEIKARRAQQYADLDDDDDDDEDGYAPVSGGGPDFGYGGGPGHGGGYGSAGYPPPRTTRPPQDHGPDDDEPTRPPYGSGAPGRSGTPGASGADDDEATRPPWGPGGRP